LQFVRKARAVFDNTVKVFMVLAAIMVVADVLIVSSDVFLRNIGKPWTGFFEISEYSLLWIVFLSTTWILKNNGHIRLDLVVSRLSPVPRAIVDVITSAVGAALLAFITYYAIQFALNDFQIGAKSISILRPPKWTVEIIIPIGCFLLFIQFIISGLECLKNWKAISRERQVRPDNMPGGEQ
jgi:C4-dicarboxylate transporter DctQ subunit